MIYEKIKNLKKDINEKIFSYEDTLNLLDEVNSPHEMKVLIENSRDFIYTILYEKVKGKKWIGYNVVSP